jgi:hypothetical protein
LVTLTLSLAIPPPKFVIKQGIDVPCIHILLPLHYLVSTFLLIVRNFFMLCPSQFITLFFVAILLLHHHHKDDMRQPGANPTTFEFTATTPAL